MSLVENGRNNDVLCLDVGSTAVKAAVYGPENRVSEIARVSSNFITPEGQVQLQPYIDALGTVIESLSESLDRTSAIGITGMGPSMILCKMSDGSCVLPSRGSSYRVPRDKVADGLRVVEGSGIPEARGIIAGPQFAPEQLAQIVHDQGKVDNLHITSLLAAVGSVLDPNMLNKLAIPYASYMGLVDIENGRYLHELFDKLNLPRHIFPELTSGSSGVTRLGATQSDVRIYELGVDGPTLQHILGRQKTSLGFGTTLAVRTCSTSPLKEAPWSVVYFTKGGQKEIVSGKATNSGSGTLKLYFPPNTEFGKFEPSLRSLIVSGDFPELLKRLPVELPFENGERDGRCTASGLFGVDSLPPGETSEIELYYVLTEGVLFNMLQIIDSLRSARCAIDSDLSASFIATGVLAKNKTIRSLLQVMLREILGVKDPIIETPVLEEVGLTSTAVATLQKEGIPEGIPRFSHQEDDLVVSPDAIEQIKVRWQRYLKLYQAGTS